MKFFTGIEFLRSIIITSTAAFALGCIYKMAHALLLAVCRTVLILYHVCVAIRNRKTRKLHESIKELESFNISIKGLSLNVFEGVLFTLFGIVFIILLYVALDGVFRFYVFVLFASFFILAANTLGEGAATLFNMIFQKVYALFFILVYVTVLPLYLLIEKALKLISKMLLPLKKRRLNTVSLKVRDRKIKEIEKTFNKISKECFTPEI